MASVGRTFFAYVVSFILVGLWWSIHMRVTRQLHKFDWPTAIANLFFMFTVTLVPFGSSLLGEGPANTAAWAVYWSINALVSLAMTIIMWVISRRGGLLIGGMGGRERAARLLQSVGPGIGFVVGAVLATNGELMLSRNCWVIIIPCMLLARLIYTPPKPPSEGI